MVFSSSRLTEFGVRRRFARTVVGSQADRAMSLTVTGIPLLFPRIAAHVISAQLPESRFIAFGEFQAIAPLGALPEIQMRHQQARGSSVLRRQWSTSVHGRHYGLAAHQVRSRNIGRVTAVRLRQD